MWKWRIITRSLPWNSLHKYQEIHSSLVQASQISFFLIWPKGLNLFGRSFLAILRFESSKPIFIDDPSHLLGHSLVSAVHFSFGFAKRLFLTSTSCILMFFFLVWICSAQDEGRGNNPLAEHKDRHVLGIYAIRSGEVGKVELAEATSFLLMEVLAHSAYAKLVASWW